MRSKRKYRGERSKVSRKRTYRKRTYRKRTCRKRTYKKRTYKKSRVNKRILQRGGSPKRRNPGRLSTLVRVEGVSEWTQCLITHDLSSGITEISRKNPTKERGTEAVATFDFLLPGSSFALDTNNPKRLTLDNSFSRNSILFDDEVTCVRFLDAFRSRKARGQEARRRREEAQRGREEAPVSFKIEKLLGKGAGGKVFKVIRENTGGNCDGCNYAMKSISKTSGMPAELAVIERKLLEEITRKGVPFVVRMHFAYQDGSNFYIGLDYLTKVDLGRQIDLADDGRTALPPAQIKKYAAQIVLAIEGLHKIGIVHRDMKSENIGIDARDNAILLDFGHSTRGSAVTSGLKTRCCTQYAMAPEVLTQSTYGQAVDWWGLGYIIYEMHYKEGPFLGPSEPDYIEQITHEPPSRSIVDPFFGGLLIQLLKKNPEERLTNPEVIKKTDFFSEIGWSKLLVEGTKVHHPPVGVIYDEDIFLKPRYVNNKKPPVGETITIKYQSDDRADDFPDFNFTGYDDL